MKTCRSPLIDRPTSAASKSSGLPACGLNRRMVRSRAVQLDVPIQHLLVDGDQLFVGRLQLFFGRLELLVDALQFFVGGLHFLVGCLEFFGRRFMLLQGLEILAGFKEIGFKFGDAARLLSGAKRRNDQLPARRHKGGHAP